jgi:hypothetical protein
VLVTCGASGFVRIKTTFRPPGRKAEPSAVPPSFGDAALS